jgi:DNA-binding NarL/FixJ family response regulator
MPDVILLDLDLNGKSSLDCLPALLSNNVSRVLVLTAERRQSILETAIVRGARGVLHKDTEAEQVLKAIEKIYQGELWINQDMLGCVLGKLTAQGKTIAPDPEKEKIASLTIREKKIIDTVVRENGAPNKIIAQRLFISEHTLRNHLTSIYQKLAVGNRLELYVYAVRHALAVPGAAPQARPDRHAQDGRRQPSHAL